MKRRKAYKSYPDSCDGCARQSDRKEVYGGCLSMTRKPKTLWCYVTREQAAAIEEAIRYYGSIEA